MIMLFVTGCGILDLGGPFLIEFPPEALEIPINDNVDENAFYHVAVDINESNLIIGYTNSTGAYATAGPETEMIPTAGFAVNADDTGYTDLSAPVAGSTASWPLDINNAGAVVGAYIEALSDGTHALRAYSIKADGSSFMSLHPAEEVSSKATHVNENGRIFGVIEKEPGPYFFLSEAVEFTVDDTGKPVATRLLPGYFDSYVQAVNETWVVVYATETEDSRSKHVLYTIAEGTYEELVIPGIVTTFNNIVVKTISNDGTMVGWYTDDLSAGSFGHVGFTYRIGDSAVSLYRMLNVVGQWEYVEYQFFDFDSKGTIVGVAYRIDPDSILQIPQARAMRLEWDFSGWADITPDNGGAYGEAYGITEDGWVAGYAGFASFKTVRDAGFAVKIK